MFMLPRQGFHRSEVAAFVDSQNLHRRHLTREQKRDVIAAKLRANPERSNRDIAAEVKVNHRTVATVRSEISGGEILHLPPEQPKPVEPPAANGDDTDDRADEPAPVAVAPIPSRPNGSRRPMAANNGHANFHAAR